MKFKASIVLLPAFLLIFSACRKDPSVPEISTLTVQNLDYYSANCGGMITGDGGAEITSRGICWSTHPNPTISDDTTLNLGEKHHLTALMQDLTPSTSYYVRAYAINSAGTGYGEVISFSTLKGSLAEVLTLEPEEVYSVMAKVSGNVVSDGELTISGRGICWNTEPMPTSHHNKVTIPGGSGLFSANIQGLSPGTVYYIRAYAINNIGIAYGNQIILTTPPSEPEPDVVTGEVEILNHWVVTVPVSINRSESLPIVERGVCYSTSPLPTINDLLRIGPQNKDDFTLELYVVHNTTYYLRAFARTMLTTTYGNQAVFTTPGLGLPCAGNETVTDIDGNIYNTVQIMDLCWMKENLKTTRFRNGDEIPFSTSIQATPAMTWYDQNHQWKDLYGGLYNEEAAKSNNGICPEGWRLPYEVEIYKMMEFALHLAALESVQHYKTLFMSPRVEPGEHPRWIQNLYIGNDLSGFSALPGGFLNTGPGIFNGFKYLGYFASWWLADQQRMMLIYNDGAGNISLWSNHGYFIYVSIRCVKD